MMMMMISIKVVVSGVLSGKKPLCTAQWSRFVVFVCWFGK